MLPLHAVLRATAANHYVILFTNGAHTTRVGPLAEYAVRGELARLGIAGSDIDVWIESAPLASSASDQRPTSTIWVEDDAHDRRRAGATILMTLGGADPIVREGIGIATELFRAERARKESKRSASLRASARQPPHLACQP